MYSANASVFGMYDLICIPGMVRFISPSEEANVVSLIVPHKPPLNSSTSYPFSLYTTYL